MDTLPGTPVDRILTASLAVSSALTLLSSLLYAVNGWEDGAAAVLQIVGGVLGALAVVRLVTYLRDLPWLSAAVLVLGLAGACGVVAYGINTIAVGLGGLDLIDKSGAAAVLKPLGLFWPLALLLAGIGLLRGRRVPSGVALGIAVAAVAFPVTRIANLAWPAVAVDVVLLACLAALPVVLRDAEQAPHPVPAATP
ncbi:hypothetical protein [Blastococcus sp. URHD0036]|uniref:hypothetical protein n=1 Tax=Blastococcus sp. URHD0036 TaxID=1380356 RepID=UPI0004986679|nr:hypothetical protein [Blastococcus sp. URHD0036]